MIKNAHIEDGIFSAIIIFADKSKHAVNATREEIVSFLLENRKPRMVYQDDGITWLDDKTLLSNYVTILERIEKQKAKAGKPSSGRGGFRENSGRKPKDTVASQTVTFKLRKDFLTLINENFPNRSDFIQRAVKEKLKREGLI